MRTYLSIGWVGVLVVSIEGPPDGAKDPPVPPDALLGPERLSEGSKAILGGADGLEVLSLDPKPPRPGEKPRERFHGRAVLGKTAIADGPGRREVLAAVRDGAGRFHRLAAPDCFNPRHGLRVTRAGKVVDLVICFECRRMVAYLDGKAEGTFVPAFAEDILDRVLVKAKVPLAAKPRK